MGNSNIIQETRRDMQESIRRIRPEVRGRQEKFRKLVDGSGFSRALVIGVSVIAILTDFPEFGCRVSRSGVAGADSLAFGFEGFGSSFGSLARFWVSTAVWQAALWLRLHGFLVRGLSGV